MRDSRYRVKNGILYLGSRAICEPPAAAVDMQRQIEDLQATLDAVRALPVMVKKMYGNLPGYRRQRYVNADELEAILEGKSDD